MWPRIQIQSSDQFLVAPSLLVELEHIARHNTFYCKFHDLNLKQVTFYSETELALRFQKCGEWFKPLLSAPS